jgi:hypothetical protein
MFVQKAELYVLEIRTRSSSAALGVLSSQHLLHGVGILRRSTQPLIITVAGFAGKPRVRPVPSWLLQHHDFLMSLPFRFNSNVCMVI